MRGRACVSGRGHMCEGEGMRLRAKVCGRLGVIRGEVMRLRAIRGEVMRVRVRAWCEGSACEGMRARACV